MRTKTTLAVRLVTRVTQVIHVDSPKTLNDVLFRIQSGQRTKPLVACHDKLKPYLGDDKPDWFDHNKT